jgi:hypothetical protein
MRLRARAHRAAEVAEGGDGADQGHGCGEQLGVVGAERGVEQRRELAWSKTGQRMVKEWSKAGQRRVNGLNKRIQ